MNIKDFKITEESINEQPMIYARNVGEYGPQNAVLMEQFKEWLAENGHMNDETTILGIAKDNVQFSKPEECRYDVCLLGTIEGQLPAWIKADHLCAGKYCVVELPHTAEAVAYVWQVGFEHLIGMGYEIDFSKPVIERYKKSLVDEHLCEMLFPIK